MKIAIVGFDTEGRATYDYFVRPQPNPTDPTGPTDPADPHKQPVWHEISIRDQKTDIELPAGADAVLGPDYLRGLGQYDLIIRTAGLHPRKIIEANPDIAATDIAAKISTHVNEFLKAAPTNNIIGVTGTKGKGTTSTLITKMLEASRFTGGAAVRLGGNIGVPPLTFIDELDKDSWVVLELSSFQLIDLKQSPRFAVCLMVAPEHLDWHTDLEEYYTAKEQLFARQVNGDVAVYYHNSEISKRIASAGQSQKIPYYHSPGAEITDDGTTKKIAIEGIDICRTDELKLLGQHNWQNACAAVTAAWYAQAQTATGPTVTATEPDMAAMRQVLTSFSGLEHRLELVRVQDGVKYYDDSFGTTPETATVAIHAFTQPKIVILGGSDKGANYDELSQAVANGNVRSALLVGEQAGRIQQALEAVGFSNYQPGGSTMPEIVKNAAAVARPGDIVLLSTGCASFDMFKNYKDRGEQFKRAVLEL